MNLEQTMIKASLVALLAWLPMSSVNANPGGSGMMPCEMHKGPGMGPMMRQQMGCRPPMEGMPGNMMQHRRHHQMMHQPMMGSNGMIKRQMMQQRMQHMQRMEERLENIESLLQELVELQKQGQPAQQQR